MASDPATLAGRMGRNNDMSCKTICISGGASGIGLATAHILHARGANICVGDLDTAAIATAKQSLEPQGSPERTHFTVVDVSKRASVDGWIAEVVQEFGRLDGAANCAGVIGKHHGTRAVQDLDDDQWDLIMGVNLTGMMYCMRAQLRVMGEGGSMVCVSSVQGLLGFAKHAAYVASKHGILGE